MHKIVVITIFTLLSSSLLLVSSCSALRNYRRVEQVDSLFTDKTTTAVRDTMTQVTHQVITQTVVEFYPPAPLLQESQLSLSEPAVAPDMLTDNKSELSDTKSDAPPQQQSEKKDKKPKAQQDQRVQQPIKSITRTEIRTEAAAAAVRDSTEKKDIAIDVETKTEEATKEKTPVTLKTLIWTTLFLFALATLLIIIRIPKRRY